jgi:hypothetical protein
MKLGRWSGVAAALTCLLAVAPRFATFMSAERWQEQGPVGPVPATLILAAGVAALAFGPLKPAGALLAALAGVALLLKPALWPIHHDGGPHSFTSETHLYYVVPGLLSSLLAVGLALAPKAGPWHRGHVWAVAGLSVPPSFVLMLTFFAGRGGFLDVAASLLPAIALAILAIALALRETGAPAAPVSPYAPTSLVPGFSYATDPGMQSLLRAVAQAPYLDGGAAGAVVGQRFGHFEIVELLGSGGMGRVYRTRDLRLLRDVALKLLPSEATHDPARRERFLREAQAAARINHPNVAAIYDVSLDGEAPFLVMELVTGVTLRRLLRDRSLDLPRLRSIALGVAAGLAAAHRQAIVHRDLKPDNVMCSAEGVAKILDFGVARLASDEARAAPGGAARAHHTRHGQLLGTPAYMSPEQARGEPVDLRSDLFSFGTMLVEMLTGAAPFARRTSDETLGAVAAAELPAAALAAMPSEPLRAVVRRCLAPAPAERYQSADELAAALAQAWPAW